MPFNALSLIYYIIVVSLACVSGVLSYFGVLVLLKEFAIAFAVVISLWLIAANMVIHRDRMAGRGVGRGLALFACGAVFSFVSNFNQVYTNQMEKDLAVQTVAAGYETFRSNLMETRAALQDTSQIELAEKQRASFDRELQRLYSQITDPGNPGVGVKAQQHIARVYEILGAPLSDLRQPTSNSLPEEVEAWFAAFKDAAIEDYERKSKTTDVAEYTAVVKLISDNLDQFKEPPVDAESTDLGLLKEFSTRSQEVERRANALLDEDSNITAKPIDFLDGRLGEIAYSLQNGFVERPNISVTSLSTVIASSVDLLPLFFALLAFRAPSNRTSEDFHHRVGRAVRDKKGLT